MLVAYSASVPWHRVLDELARTLCPGMIVTLRNSLLEDAIMLWTIAVILIILWALGFFVFPVAGSLIHLLLVIAVIVIIYRLITGRPVV
jgi:hypothetical protein